MIRWLVPLVLFAAATAPAQSVLRVGSKTFTESVILGDIMTQLIRHDGVPVEHRRTLGGTRILWSALLSGDIDVYPEYTGTIRHEILPGAPMTEDSLAITLAKLGIGISAPLGFNNTYALGMTADRADSLGIRTISDLSKFPSLAFGFTNEFMDRSDGWPALRRGYRLPQTNVFGLDHDLAYRALSAGTIDVTDLYATDAEIEYYHLRILSDDARQFPDYDAVFLYRLDASEKFPSLPRAIQALEGRLRAGTMIRLNARVKLGQEAESAVAADFITSQLAIAVRPDSERWGDRLWRHTIDHGILVAVSLSAAILIAIPLGIWSHKQPRIGSVILAVVGVIQTIPSLAILVFMIPLMGIGSAPAIAALFLYSLLPIVRNTHAGLELPLPLRESAEALGLRPAARLWLVELPLASRSILAGIKISAVINVGTATLGALIGAGGYGQPILTGIRLDNVTLILEGAVPAAVMALAVQQLFEAAERWLVPKGLRLKREA